MSGDLSIVEQVIHRAIEREIDAHTVYSNAAAEVTDMPAKGVLEELAADELQHKVKLEALLEGDTEKLVTKPQKIIDLKIGDYLIGEPLGPNADLQKILIVASHREKASYDFYTAMAQISADDSSKQLFEWLAAEELGHKNKIETIYDDIVYSQF